MPGEAIGLGILFSRCGLMNNLLLCFESPEALRYIPYHDNQRILLEPRYLGLAPNNVLFRFVKEHQILHKQGFRGIKSPGPNHKLGYR